MYVIDEGKFETIDLLLSNGAEFDTLDVDGKSPLYYAVSRDRMIDRLVDNGADINAPPKVHLVGSVGQVFFFLFFSFFWKPKYTTVVLGSTGQSSQREISQWRLSHFLGCKGPAEQHTVDSTTRHHL